MFSILGEEALKKALTSKLTSLFSKGCVRGRKRQTLELALKNISEIIQNFLKKLTWTAAVMIIL